MHVLLIIIGLLFMLFGGGCTLLIAGLSFTEPSSILNDPTGLSVLIFMGLLPLGIGWLLFRWGMKIDREKRRAGARPPNQGEAT